MAASPAEADHKVPLIRQHHRFAIKADLGIRTGGAEHDTSLFEIASQLTVLIQLHALILSDWERGWLHSSLMSSAAGMLTGIRVGKSWYATGFSWWPGLIFIQYPIIVKNTTKVCFMSKTILAIDTVSEQCSVSLLHNGELTGFSERAPQQHARLVLPWIDQLLTDAGLARSAIDLIAVDHGPGSFTGVRIGVSIAQALAFGFGRPVAGLSSLRALAWAAQRETGAETVLAAMDARMDEIYCAGFRFNGPDIDEFYAHDLLSPDDLRLEHDVDVLVGSAFEAFAGRLQPVVSRAGQCLPDRFPQASAIAAMAEIMNESEYSDVSSLQPLYLRNNVAKKSAAATKTG